MLLSRNFLKAQIIVFRSYLRPIISLMATTAVLLLGSCLPESEVEEPQFEYDYFAQRIGHYQIYAVDSSYYRQNVLYPLNYFIKVRVQDSLRNDEGGYTSTIRVQKRFTESQPWANYRTNSQRISGELGIFNEGNVPFIKFAFPPAKGLYWNANAYNSLGGTDLCGNQLDVACDIYTMGEVTRYTLSPTLDFEKTITIEQQNDVDVIVGDDVRKEIYAKGVGLIFKEYSLLEYCTDANRCAVGSKFIDRGVKYKQVLIEYGVE